MGIIRNGNSLQNKTALSIATQLINRKVILQMYGSDLINQWQTNDRDD